MMFLSTTTAAAAACFLILGPKESMAWSSITKPSSILSSYPHKSLTVQYFHDGHIKQQQAGYIIKQQQSGYNFHKSTTTVLFQSTNNNNNNEDNEDDNKIEDEGEGEGVDDSNKAEDKIINNNKESNNNDPLEKRLLSSSLDINMDTFNSIQSNILSGELGSRGEIYFILQISLVLCIALGQIPLSPLFTILMGPILCLGGLLFAIYSALFMGPNLSPWPVPPPPTSSSSSSKLIQSGPFAWMRHPIYTGLLATCLGLSIWTESMIRLILTLGLFILLELKSNYEENALVNVYGTEYESYRVNVPSKFIPKIVLEFFNSIGKES